jgi:DNA gyrase/topoisomerase IV subunit A
VIRTRVEEIKQAGRATRGVRVMNLGEGENVATLARISAADLLRAGVNQENGSGE